MSGPDPAPAPMQVVAPDGSEVTILGSTLTDQAAVLADKEGEWAGRRALAQFVETERDTKDIKEWAWEFIDKYTPFPVPGSQGGPSEWPQYPAAVNTGSPVADAITNLNNRVLVLFNRSEILRVQQARDEVRWVKVAKALEVLFAVAGHQIERDPTLVPPPDR